MAARCRQQRSCPWVRGGEGAAVERCVGSWSQEGGEQPVCFGCCQEQNHGSECSSTSIQFFFSVASLLLWEVPKLGVIQWGPTIRVFGDALLAPRRVLQTQSLGGAARRDIPRQTCGQRQAGWRRRQGLCAAAGLQPQTEMIGQIQFHRGLFCGIKGSF